MQRFLFLLFFLFSTLFANTLQTDYTTVTLQAENLTIASQSQQLIAIKFTPKPGWHTYWKNPGDAGLAPFFEWQLPAGVRLSEAYFQVPKYLPYGDLLNIGYKDESVVFFTLFTKDIKPGNVYPLALNLEWLVCKDICITESGRLNLNIEGHQRDIPSKDYLNILDDFKKVPQKMISTSFIDVADNSVLLTVENIKVRDVKKVSYFPESAGIINYQQNTAFTLMDETLRMTFDKGYSSAKIIENGLLILETATGQESFQLSANNRTFIPENNNSFWVILVFAFLGGLILNIMPCVFPILSLKIISLVDSQNRKKESIFYSIGVMVSFGVLAGLLSLLKFSGQAVGWGFQLQSPYFVLALIYLFYLVGLNLLGLFELPKFIYSISSLTDRFTGLSKNNTAAPIFTGIFAVIVATPCTAPFMAAALGYTLTQPFILSLLIFLMMGFGMAFPFLLVSFIPRLASLLPRPGHWMITFKKIMAIPMLLSMLWLLWVLEKQVNEMVLIAASVGLVALFMLSYLRKESNRRPKLLEFILTLILIGLIGAPVLMQIYAKPTALMPTTQSIESKIMSHLNEGQKVFVDVTAAWCITCQVNKKTTLDTEEISTYFEDHNIKLLRLDWTNYDANITRYLEKYGRNGVPLYIYYAPGKAPAVLPQILNKNVLEERIGL